MDTASRFRGSSTLDSFIASVYKGAKDLPVMCLKPLCLGRKSRTPQKGFSQDSVTYALRGSYENEKVTCMCVKREKSRGE